tara:strand:- start:1318 stop:2064 length:747 start_codon:yes stop_codon:yes gene_type:complete
MNNTYQVGNGIFFRDAGKFPPSVRKLLSEVGNEPITSIKLFKYPLIAVGIAASIASKGKVPYDKLIHLGMEINGKYLLDKDAVIHFRRGSIPQKKGLQTMSVSEVASKPVLTINELLEKTKERVGDKRMTSYSSFKNNCQRFIQDLLITGRWNTPQTTAFVVQSAPTIDIVKKDLPGFAEPLVDIYTGFKAFLDRQLKGEGVPSVVALRTGQGICGGGAGFQTEWIRPLNPYGLPTQYNFINHNQVKF